MNPEKQEPKEDLREQLAKDYGYENYAIMRIDVIDKLRVVKYELQDRFMGNEAYKEDVEKEDPELYEKYRKLSNLDSTFEDLVVNALKLKSRFE